MLTHDGYVPRVFLNTVYGYRRISVGVRGIGPTDRSRFYVTDRGHSRKEHGPLLAGPLLSPLRCRPPRAVSLYHAGYCREIATDKISPRF